jgi:hypothetical protein
MPIKKDRYDKNALKRKWAVARFLSNAFFIITGSLYYLQHFTFRYKTRKVQKEIRTEVSNKDEEGKYFPTPKGSETVGFKFGFQLQNHPNK